MSHLVALTAGGAFDEDFIEVHDIFNREIDGREGAIVDVFEVAMRQDLYVQPLVGRYVLFSSGANHLRVLMSVWISVAGLSIATHPAGRWVNRTPSVLKVV